VRGASANYNIESTTYTSPFIRITTGLHRTHLIDNAFLLDENVHANAILRIKFRIAVAKRRGTRM
jgi:hypothetical protein